MYKGTFKKLVSTMFFLIIHEFKIRGQLHSKRARSVKLHEYEYFVICFWFPPVSLIENLESRHVRLPLIYLAATDITNIHVGAFMKQSMAHMLDTGLLHKITRK